MFFLFYHIDCRITVPLRPWAVASDEYGLVILNLRKRKRFARIGVYYVSKHYIRRNQADTRKYASATGYPRE